MHVENGTLVMDQKDCTCCTNGTQPTRCACPECKGTGKGKRGGRNGCKRCSGLRYIWDTNKPQTCSKCNGNYKNHEQENHCDTLPDNIWQSFTFVVYRHDRPISMNESLLGLDCVFSCGDYGAAWNANDDAALIANVKSHTHHQACKVTKKDGTLASHIGIFLSRGGYSVRPVFDSISEVVAQVKSERPEGEYLAVANALCEQGLNGTLLAIRR